MQSKILIVEDEKKIAMLLKDYLEQAGFFVSILDRGDLVSMEVRKNPPDLVLLDVQLPGKDGLSVCKEVRGFSKVPIIMLTARIEEIDRLLGLELGADDYICKPFSPREVVARVKAVLRRSTSGPEKSALKEGPITLDPETHKVTINGKFINLTPSEFELLEIMMSKPDRVFSRDDLVSLVQGYDFGGYNRTIDTHIKNLRKKLGDKIPDKVYIHTVYGLGYKFSLED